MCMRTITMSCKDDQYMFMSVIMRAIACEERSSTQFQSNQNIVNDHDNTIALDSIVGETHLSDTHTKQNKHDHKTGESGCERTAGHRDEGGAEVDNILRVWQEGQCEKAHVAFDVRDGLQAS